ncbi:MULTISPECIES: amino acid ABC transporter permease [Shouchella]|uniref:Amino acid ABC transporter permease n=2 Tax=Shouchella TaxID=2893057 RepID=A0ABY7WCH7_9BACI|nr:MULTISPECIES: amino acid ABC transporter permease [Shouchella]MED4126955.1 amino acid ABC transporter permease [Shouchella miscanthi]WDF05338.1 amino acid ABC transporter permease [Shouchella hunanensis]GAF23872.1 glutamate transport membrane-spanning protein [Bacillus sp. JCM 19047]
MDFDFGAFPFLVEGLKLTIIITLVGVFFGSIIGSLVGLMKLSRFKLIKAVAVVFVEVIRGTPLLAQIFFIHFGIPGIFGVRFDPLYTGIFVIAINSGAYIAEIVRGAIQSIDKGQMEAGRSLGLTGTQTMRHIVWPQAVKVMIPPFGNQFVISLKDTSLLSTIAVADLMYQSRTYTGISASYFDTYLLVCLFYLAITIPASILLRYIERRLDH